MILVQIKNKNKLGIDHVIASIGGSLNQLNPRVVSLKLRETTETSMLVSTQVNFTNPTNHSATIPFVDLLIRYNDSTVAHITAHNISIVTGNNSYVPVEFYWYPLGGGGAKSVEAGRKLLSSYISGQSALDGIIQGTSADALVRLKHNNKHQKPQRHNSLSPRSWRSTISP